MLIRW